MKKNLLFALAFSMLLTSCGGKTDSHEGHGMDHSTADPTTSESVSMESNNATTAIIDSYLAVKDALVADDYAGASTKNTALVTALKNFDATNSEELKKLQAYAIASAENLATEDAAAQRENFQALSVTLKDFLKIAGTDRTLYQQHCPMYKGTGGIWLSASEDIKNPLFGSKMLTCGRVAETLTSL